MQLAKTDFMSEQKHTPGPLYAEGLSIFKDYGDQRFLIAEVEDHDEAQADAILFAAAPELLSVLGLILAEWNSDPRSTQCFDRVIIDFARAVIAKAEGAA